MINLLEVRVKANGIALVIVEHGAGEAVVNRAVDLVQTMEMQEDINDAEYHF